MPVTRNFTSFSMDVNTVTVTTECQSVINFWMNSNWLWPKPRKSQVLVVRVEKHVRVDILSPSLTDGQGSELSVCCRKMRIISFKGEK